MNYLSFSGIIIFATSIASSIFVFYSKPRTTLKLTWGLFCLSVSLWGFGLFKAFITVDYNNALFWARFLNLSALTIPLFFVHFVFLFSNKIQPKKKELSIYYIIVCVILFLAIFAPREFIPSLSPKSGFPFYPNPGLLYYVFSLIFVFLSGYGSYLLFLESKRENTIRSYQAKYILFGVTIGFLGGGSTFLEVFDLNIYPFGTSLVTIYVVLTTYAIIRYRLMDIKLVITRFGIFVFVYSVVLGIPFGLVIGLREWLMGFFGQGWFWAPMVSLLVLATAGPFIYLFIQRRAEEVLLQEQRQYQKTLRQASTGMARVKEIDKLLNLMVHIVSRTVRLEYCAIYLLDGTRGNYVLKASRGSESLRSELLKELEAESVLIKRLKEKQEIIVCEEIRQKAVDISDAHAGEMVSTIRLLGAELVVPSLDGENLIAVLVLGKKKSGEIYSPDDLLVFSILANQSALGI
ncbi:MAG: GAF domain-containing protein, partial [Candidatus Omnitrophica bacterium]|nr:GAF domain-containing protein [Candidatus Omnitrophota bacterium]